MSDDKTKIMGRPASFEEKVLAQLESVNSRLAGLEKREAERDEATNPAFGQLLSEFQDLSRTVHVYLDNFDGKLDVINNELLQVKVNYRVIERRISKIEVENRPQSIKQETEF